MTRYVATFFKTVLGENGHPAEICQRIVEIEAPTEADAAAIAKQQFCKAEQVTHWDLHADRINVAEAECPS